MILVVLGGRRFPRGHKIFEPEAGGMGNTTKTLAWKKKRGKLDAGKTFAGPSEVRNKKQGGKPIKYGGSRQQQAKMRLIEDHPKNPPKTVVRGTE